MTDLATNPQGNGAVAPEAETEVDPALTAVDENAELDPATGEPVTPIDDTEEIEREGKKYRIPKALKGEFLMQRDYTTKTQEVAEQRKALETRQTEFSQQAQAQAEHIQDVSAIVGLNNQITAFEKLDWDAIATSDQANGTRNYESLWRQYQQTKDARDRAGSQLQQKINERTQAAQRAFAKRTEESGAILAREITGWSPDLFGKMSDFAVKEFGFTPSQVEMSKAETGLMKLLHRAYLGDQAMKREAAAKKLAGQEGITPVRQVGSRAQSTTPKPSQAASDRQSVDAWMRARNQEVAKR